MGTYTPNNWFYLPAKGATGDTEKGYFDAALTLADQQLEDSKNITVIGNVPFPVLGGTGYETIAAALTTIGSTATTLCLPSTAGAVAITGNTTIPANIHLRIDQGAYFNISAGATLTINGTIEAGPYKIFQWTTTGKVKFGQGAASEYNFRWWGATGDGVTDDTAAIQKALDCGGTTPTYGSFCLVGNPDDVYRVSTVNALYSCDTPHTGRVFVIDGRGALIKQYGIQTDPLVELYGAEIKFVFQNWSLLGNTRYIFKKTSVNSAPSTVVINGNSAASKGSIALLTSNYDYYYDSTGKILYIYYTTPSNTEYPEEKGSGVVVDDVTLTGFERYLPSSALQMNVAADAVVRNLFINDFGVGLDLQGSQYGGYDGIVITRCNKAITSTIHTSNCMGNKFLNFRCYSIYSDMIYWTSGANTNFDKFSCEAISGRIAYVDNVEAISFNSFRLEGIQCIYNSTATDGFYFYQTEGVDIYGCMLNGGGSVFASSMTRLFHFNKTRGVNIHGNKLYVVDSTGTSGPLYVEGVTKKCYLYYAEDVESGGIIFSGNQLNIKRCTNGQPIAVFKDNNCETNSYLQFPIGTLSPGLSKEYFIDPTFASGVIPSDLVNATCVQADVTSAIGNAIKGLKVTITGASPSFTIANSSTNPTTPTDEYYVPVLSFSYLAEADISFKFYTNNGPGMGAEATVIGDGLWHRCSVVGGKSFGNTPVTALFFASDVSSGEIYFTNFSLTFHRSKNIAMDFMDRVSDTVWDSF